MDENDAALIAAWRGERPDEPADDATLGPWLSSVAARGRAAWPALAVPAERFVRRLAHHFGGGEPLGAWLGRLRAEDLYLACACEARAPGALEIFEREFLSAVPAIVRRSGAPASQADEIAQRVRERLFVGAARIADYSGRGALAHWLEVVTLRVAIDARREERAVATDAGAAAAALALAGVDPELELLKERYRGPVELAFRAALSALTSEQRNLLKLHFVDGVKLEDLAALLRVHRATIVRRIAAAREAVLDGARARLEAELSLDRDELDQIIRLIRSRLDISLSVLLS